MADLTDLLLLRVRHFLDAKSSVGLFKFLFSAMKRNRVQLISVENNFDLHSLQIRFSSSSRSKSQSFLHDPRE